MVDAPRVSTWSYNQGSFEVIMTNNRNMVYSSVSKVLKYSTDDELLGIYIHGVPSASAAPASFQLMRKLERKFEVQEPNAVTVKRKVMKELVEIGITNKTGDDVAAGFEKVIQDVLNDKKNNSSYGSSSEDDEEDAGFSTKDEEGSDADNIGYVSGDLPDH